MFRFTTAILLVVVAAALAACGSDGTATRDEGGDADRTIEIDMVDIAFEPTDLEVTAGETVRFVFTNRGDVAHDAFIGDAADQDDHAADMLDDHGGHGDDGDDGITVEPGETAELTHTVTADDDELLIGCHQPGHYDAGMVATVHLT